MVDLKQKGLVQSAREFYNKLVSVLKDCGFKASSVDPCHWIKYSNQSIVLIAIYVDDCLMIETDSKIDTMPLYVLALMIIFTNPFYQLHFLSSISGTEFWPEVCIVYGILKHTNKDLP
jgi:hypothetical protein